jgi:hypothetical protein
MAKTIEDVEQLLAERGYACRRMSGQCVQTQLPTEAYVNREGRKAIDVQILIDEQHGCLTMDTPWAFDSHKAEHKEAMLTCLLTASGQSPMVKTQLDPADGEVRLRVDCRLGTAGVDGDDVFTLLSLIPAFADRWYPHIKSAMEKGTFDASGSLRQANDDRFAAIASRCGGINRLEALFRMQERRKGPPPGTDPSSN